MYLHLDQMRHKYFYSFCPPLIAKIILIFSIQIGGTSDIRDISENNSENFYFLIAGVTGNQRSFETILSINSERGELDFLGFTINEMSCSSLDSLSDVSVLSSINSKVKAGRLNDD